ncbi:MAG: hypothetical protein QOD41_2103, partial [Cryptosporangiaceae bacterium]|nr:hypothetical protein [Cryptosporangiaceae bacterium]
AALLYAVTGAVHLDRLALAIGVWPALVLAVTSTPVDALVRTVTR